MRGLAMVALVATLTGCAAGPVNPRLDAYGLLEGLQSITYQPATGAERTLLADVDVISSVSGGSFTAAHYALFGTEGFKRFEDNFLYRNIQGELIARALAPWNWTRLLRSDYSRIDLAAD